MDGGGTVAEVDEGGEGEEAGDVEGVVLEEAERSGCAAVDEELAGCELDGLLQLVPQTPQ